MSTGQGIIFVYPGIKCQYALQSFFDHFLWTQVWTRFFVELEIYRQKYNKGYGNLGYGVLVFCIQN